MNNLVKNIKGKKILIISNNSLSTTSSVGKTLASFFDSYQPENIRQIYFKEESPTSEVASSYFQITDRDMVHKFFKRRHNVGEIKEVSNKTKSKSNISGNSFKKSILLNNFTRILREIIWMDKNWNNDFFNIWLDEFKPEIIFFYAGDTGYAYNIFKYIKSKYKSKSIIYIADDYILKRFELSPFWWVRRNMIVRKMREVISEADMFLTISKEMSMLYYKIFNKKSNIFLNMSESMLIEDALNPIREKNIFNLIYAGGFHFNRDKTLISLIKSIKNINQNSSHKMYLKIFSNNVPSDKLLKKFNVSGVSKFYGGLDLNELKRELNKADFTVHVESFNRKSIRSTKLSISTKIPEYLSLGKPIVSIGPEEVSSILYLKDYSLSITNLSELEQKLKSFINDKEKQEELGNKALMLYEENHNPQIKKKELIDIINSIK